MKKIIALLTAAVMLLSLVACGSSSASSAAADTAAAPAASAQEASAADAAPVEVTKIVVGSGTTYAPFCYIDENGDAVGFEYDLLQAVDELLPQYEFEYQPMNFDSLVLALDADKIDMAGHQFEYSDTRAEKYLFGNESYSTYTSYLSVLVENDTVHSLEDLAGKKVQPGGATSQSAAILQEWNDNHPGQELDLVYNDTSTDEAAVAALKSGAIEALVNNISDINLMNKNFGNGTDIVKAVGDPINDSKTFYLYTKGHEELRDAVDGALKTLKENGTIAELSIKWVGTDLTGD